MDTEGLLTVADVAARLKVSPETVREWLRNDRLDGYNLGGQAGWRIPEAAVERLLHESARKRTRG
ncbi:MAG TPA: helix-turn-helix domain-containing protein [Chloroflexota bacterium]|nr:helix-turn-helix domain-containing protein [Chloroflexota bacterium]